MRALLRKELRELAPAWVLLLVFLLPDILRASQSLTSLMPSSLDPLTLFRRALLIGAGIGYAQLRREIWRGTLSNLVHRDTAVLGALAAKALAGIAVAYGLVALPVLIGAMIVGVLEPLFFEPALAARLCLVASAVVTSYAVGALGATWRGRLSTRLIATGSGLFALHLAGKSVVVGAEHGNDGLRLYVVGALLTGVGLFALAGWRIERIEDAERRASPREVALRTLAAAGLVLAPVWFTCWSLRTVFFSALVTWNSRFPDPSWVWLGDSTSWAQRSGIWMVGLDRQAGVVHAFDLRGVEWMVDQPPQFFHDDDPQHFLLQPRDGPFGHDVEVLRGGWLHDPRSDIAWRVVGQESPRLEGRSSASDDSLSGSATRDLRPFVRIRNPDLHDYRFDVFDPSSGKVLYTYQYAPQSRIAWAMLHAFAFFHGPLAATLAFASLAEPADAMALPFAEPLLVGRQRPWLLAGTYAIFLLLSALAVRHVLLTGGSRARAACWAIGLFLFGPLLYAAFQLIEPRRAYWRGSSRRASRPQVSARVVSPAAP